MHAWTYVGIGVGCINHPNKLCKHIGPSKRRKIRAQVLSIGINDIKNQGKGKTQYEKPHISSESRAIIKNQIQRCPAEKKEQNKIKNNKPENILEQLMFLASKLSQEEADKFKKLFFSFESQETTDEENN